MDVNKGGACVCSRDGILRVDGRWSSRLCRSLSVVGRFYRCLIRCRLLRVYLVELFVILGVANIRRY